jgi:hypothetical protein
MFSVREQHGSKQFEVAEVLYNELCDHDLHSLCLYLMFDGLLQLKSLDCLGVYHADRNAEVVTPCVKCIKFELAHFMICSTLVLIFSMRM